MKRNRANKSGSGVSLFPFLAVLICTMGALIVLLVLVVQLARVSAAEDGAQTDAQHQVDARQIEAEDYVWQREVLDEQRLQAKEKLSHKRLELSHLEEHIRELERRWKAMREAAADLRLRQDNSDEGAESARAELEKLTQAIRESKEQLEAAVAASAGRSPVYAIVPYDGPNGTRRRPVHLECTEQGVVIQPEGIVLNEQDFQGPLGPGNPLDAALRAIREYYVHVGAEAAKGDPYPLLVVRPNGVEAYAAARSAIRSWDDEFGYELIDSAMQIKFPEPDPRLAQLLQKVISDARSRQAILAAAMPSRFAREEEIGFVAAPSGGFVPQGGGDRRRWGQRQGGFGRGGDSRYIQGQSGGPSGASATPIEQQTAGKATGKGHAQAVPGAKIGDGVSPLAKSRGRNWGLPNDEENATGIIRPIRLACLRDRLIILPDRGESRSPEIILVDGAMVDDIDQLVSKVWDRIDQWGIAVAGGYWKPVLHVQIAQGAEERFQELQVLLEGSGLDVKRSTK